MAGCFYFTGKLFLQLGLSFFQGGLQLLSCLRPLICGEFLNLGALTLLNGLVLGFELGKTIFPHVCVFLFCLCKQTFRPGFALLLTAFA